jgi:hypothetical protein
MPMFLCPCCADAFVVPLAFCESLVDTSRRAGWREPVAPAACPDCSSGLTAGTAVEIRGGRGMAADGSGHDLRAGAAAAVEAVSGGAGEGSIFRIRLVDGSVLYVTRAQLRPRQV